MRFPAWTRRCRSWWELALLVLFGLLHLDFLLAGYFGCGRNFGSETVEDDFGLFEVPAGIYRREGRR
jgi:hypothetical protein